MKTYRVIWTERHSADIEAKNEKAAEEMVTNGKIFKNAPPTDTYIESDFYRCDLVKEERK